MVRLDITQLPPHLANQVRQKLGLNDTQSVKKPLSNVEGKSISKVHETLWNAVKHLDGATLEFKGAVPNRRFSLDIAFPELKIAVEVDGWEFHGKHKSSHTKDRERQNLLILNGWRVLRYTAKQIFGNIEQCISEIQQLVELVQKEQQ